MRVRVDIDAMQLKRRIQRILPLEASTLPLLTRARGVQTLNLVRTVFLLVRGRGRRRAHAANGLPNCLSSPGRSTSSTASSRAITLGSRECLESKGAHEFERKGA